MPAKWLSRASEHATIHRAGVPLDTGLIGRVNFCRGWAGVGIKNLDGHGRGEEQRHWRGRLGLRTWLEKGRLVPLKRLSLLAQTAMGSQLLAARLAQLRPR